MRNFLKSTGITIGWGVTFVWMVSVGLTMAVLTAFGKVVQTCQISRSFAEAGDVLIVAAGVLSAVLVVVAMGVHTFRTGRAPDIVEDDTFGWALPIFMFSFYGPVFALLSPKNLKGQTVTGI
jgi:hypothetical protein